MRNPLNTLPQRLSRRTPSTLRTLADMESEMDRWLGVNPTDWTADYNGYDFAPSCDLRESDKEYIIKFDIPGVNKDQVNVELKNNRLTVTGERSEEKEESDARHYLSETFQGSFMRSFTLPTAVNEDRVDAKYLDGVLTIRIPKAESEHSKRVKIQ